MSFRRPLWVLGVFVSFSVPAAGATVLGHYDFAVIATGKNGLQSCAVIFTIEVLP